MFTRIAEDLPDEVGFATKKPRAESPDMALYEAYISELDDIYARTESVFKETVMPFDENCEETPGFYNKSRQIVRDSSFHELVGTSTTPFAYGRVHEYIGRICCMDNRPGREKIEGDWIPDNTTIVKARIGVPALGGFLVQHNITRKYNEGSRVIIVWRKFTEGEGAFAGMHSDEIGWNIVRPSPSCGGGSTLLESVTRFVPMNFSTATASGATVMKQFADTIIKTGEQDCQECIQMLEKMLLDDAIGVCSRTSNSYR
ncbi:unnamed protein product [Phytophthora lilii]|uniref:Unnamed protein product n=1 Tax=Phytophthora lilii TaxID=2077276 RepID=A0A9W6TEJ6_9STRA|nr:unnamed protein product [Phytophthora lilii]